MCTANRVGTILLNLWKIPPKFKTKNQSFFLFLRKCFLAYLCWNYFIIRQGTQVIIYHFLIFCHPTTIKWGWQYIIFTSFAKPKQGMMNYSISLSHKKDLFHVTLKFIYLSNISHPSCSRHHVSLVMLSNVRKLWCL